MASESPTSTPLGDRQARRTIALLKVAVLLVLLASVVLSVAVLYLLQQRDQAIEGLAVRVLEARREAESLDAENQELTFRIEELLGEVRTLASRLEEGYAPVEVGGPVDFPIMRAMARPGDTVAVLAAREGTTPDVVRALNPWLPGVQAKLQDRQALWVPKRP